MFASAISMSASNTRHVRYILPAIPFLFIMIGSLATSRKASILTVLIVAVAYNIILIVLICPGYLSYYNIPAGIIAGGPPLLDSSFDWGQDLSRLSSWIDDHHITKPVFLAAYGTVDPGLYGIKYIPAPVFLKECPSI